MISAIKTIGALAGSSWLQARGLHAHTPHWFVEIVLTSDHPQTRLEINIYPVEWGFVFRRGERVSSIRVTDIAFVHGLDEHQLLSQTPTLDRLGDLLAMLERRYELAFDRKRPVVTSNLARAAAAVRPWLETHG